MGDLEDHFVKFHRATLEFDSGSSDPEPEIVENTRNKAAESSLRVRTNAPQHANPSVLSGSDSLSSSPTSFAVPDVAGGSSNDQHQTVPRYDMPFSTESIKDFFTFRNGVVENAIQECITGLLFPDDGQLIGSFLLTEITHWDNEKERIVLLTSKMVVTVKYDFIALKKLDFKKIYLTDLDTIVLGELVYPPSSLVPRLKGIATGVTTVVKDCVIDRIYKSPAPRNEEYNMFDPKLFKPRGRNLRGIKLMWNQGQPVSMKTQWNPFSNDVPFLIFASHPIFWHKDAVSIEEGFTYDMELFAFRLQMAVSDIFRTEPIVIESYVGVTSLLHNTSSLGFFKVRGKFSF